MENNEIKFRIQKKRPKKNAKEYKLETLQDIFDATNNKNVDKFLKEFKMCLTSGFIIRELNEIENPNTKVNFHSLKWIDD